MSDHLCSVVIWALGSLELHVNFVESVFLDSFFSVQTSTLNASLSPVPPGANSAVPTDPVSGNPHQLRPRVPG